MRTPAALAAAALLACACATQPDRIDYDGAGRFVEMGWPTASGEEFAPDPNRPVTVDFTSRRLRAVFSPVPGLEPMPFGSGMHGPWDVDPDSPAVEGVRQSRIPRGDLHTTLHYIALKSGLQIIVQEGIDLQLTIDFSFPEGVDPKDRAREIIHSIAKANKLDIIEDGDVIILKERLQDKSVPCVTRSEFDGRYNAEFENHDLVEAIMETARVTHTDVFFPVTPQDQSEKSEDVVRWKRISLSVKDATTDHIMRELARLGDMTIDVSVISDDARIPGYQFNYKD